MLELKPQCFSSECPGRALFDQIADKWSMMVLTVIDDGPLGHVDKWRSHSLMQATSTKPRKLSAVLS